MKNLFQILTSVVEGKMIGVCKRKITDTHHLSLLKGFVYSSDNLICTAKGNTISLSDNENPETAPLTIDTTSIANLDYKLRKRLISFEIEDEKYVVTFA